MQSSSIALQFEFEIHEELFNLQAFKIKSQEIFSRKLCTKVTFLLPFLGTLCEV